MNRFASLIVSPGRSWVIALLAFGAAVGIIAGVGQAEREAQPTDSLPIGKQSTRVVELAEKLPQTSGSSAVVLFSANDGKLSPEALASLAERYPRLIPAEDGTAAITVVPIAASDATEIAEEVTQLRKDVSADLPSGVEAGVTGPAAIRADLAAVFEGADVRLLLATASIVALLLLITYRSPFLWLVPLSVVGVADALASTVATRVLDWTGTPWDESTTGILSVLVFGAGTDYALLLISRYRDELRSHESRYAAMRVALRGTLEAVVSSAGTVFIGLLTLMLSLVPSFRGLGLACAVGVLIAAAMVLTLLPCVLVLCGRWIFWPLTPRVGQETLVEGRSLWRRIGEAVAARPGWFAAGTVLLVALLSTGSLQIKSGLSQADQFLETPEAISVGERLAESFPGGTANPVVVLTRDDPAAVLAAVTATPGIRSAQQTAEEDTAGQADTTSPLVRIDAVTTAASDSDEAMETVSAVRAELADFEETYVGGTTAEQMDADDATNRDRLLIIPIILVLVLGALMLLLRSLVAPLILVATVAGTFLASLGAAWWIFSLLGFERLDAGVPLLAFIFGVALGVDYNIFLVSRVAEESAGRTAREGVLRGLTATGGVITSAGILLAAVFAVLGVLPLVVLAQLGTVICIGVLLDTLLVRTILVPSLAFLLGERFWWPRRVV
ncbi:MAG: MMPL family transporter [Nocardioides sp.]